MQVGNGKQTRPARICKAEIRLLLLHQCNNTVLPWTFWCPHSMGKKRGAHDSCWWFLWCWWFWRGVSATNSPGWEEVFSYLNKNSCHCFISSYFLLELLFTQSCHENFKCSWDVDLSVVPCSEPVKIIFSAVRDTIREIGENSLKWQDHNVEDHVKQIVRQIFTLLMIYFTILF